MESLRTSSTEYPAAAVEQVASVARAMRSNLTTLTDAMYTEFAELIPELRGDPIIQDLLYASTEANVETILHYAQQAIALEDIEPPTAALAYGRRLAQRGTSSNALLRAYRLGQRRFVDAAMSEIGAAEADRDTAIAAARLIHDLVNAYIDRVAVKVVAEYELERESWLANRNTVRTAVLTSLLNGEEVDVTTGEGALGYRLRQNHLGLVVWDADRENTAGALQRLEGLVTAIGEAVGAAGHPLFIPRDRALAWAWVPLGWAAELPATGVIEKVQVESGPSLRIAMGTPGKAIAGFRSTHTDAVRAYSVAAIADDRAPGITRYGDPGVKAAALLAADLPSTRDLVVNALGGLAADDETVERLRDTLLEFLATDGSYQTTAERIHVHRNTVRYRVAKALEIRGRALNDDRFDLQLALVACRWLGRSVLTH